MNKKTREEFPFKTLGRQLKQLREKRRQTLAEVSGAVEIDVTLLTDIEQGLKRPSEDILLLLISHFSIKDEEAAKLWELAGYARADAMSDGVLDDRTQPVMVMPMDLRIVYADMVHVMVNNYGVVVNFMQSAGPSNKPLAVSRVGMSKEHAESVIELLQKALRDAQPKLLPAPDQDKESTE